MPEKTSKILNKKNLCDILIPQLVNSLVNGIGCRKDQGYIEDEEEKEQIIKIEKIAEFCDIIPDKEHYGYIKINK